MLTSVLIFLAIAWIDVIRSENGVCEVDKKCFANCENINYMKIQKNLDCGLSLHVMKLGTSNIQVSYLRYFTNFNVGFLHLNNKSLKSAKDIAAYTNKLNISKLNLDNNQIDKLKMPRFLNEFPFKLFSLNNNLIKSIGTESIPKAENIYLNNNFIEVILANMFVDLTIVETLLLDNNCLKTLTDASLTGLTAKTLSLNYNQIVTLEANSIPLAQHVFLSANRLESLNASIFTNISHTTVLNLCSNNISNISEDTFKDGNFSLLLLNSNNITKITTKTFSGLNMVNFLSLSDNKIELLENASIPRVENLNLKYNPLNGIHEAEFTDLKYLKIVEVTYKDTFDNSLPKNIVVLNSGLMIETAQSAAWKITVYVLCSVSIIILVVIVIRKLRCSKRLMDNSSLLFNSLHFLKRHETANVEAPAEINIQGIQDEEIDQKMDAFPNPISNSASSDNDGEYVEPTPEYDVVNDNSAVRQYK